VLGRISTIIRQLAFWFPVPENHKDEGYMYVPEGKGTGPRTAAAPPTPAKRDVPEGPSRALLPAHNALLVQGDDARNMRLALREAGIEVFVENDPLRAERLMRRTKFDAVIVDLSTMDRAAMGICRALRNSDSKGAFLIFLADNPGVAEHEKAARLGADALWTKMRLQADVVGSLSMVSADRAARPGSSFQI